MHKNKRMAALLCAGLALAILAGCVPRPQITLADDSVTVGGSTSLANIAGKALEVFMADSGAVSTYTPGSSQEGLIGVESGNFDFAFSSYLPETELEAVVFAQEGLCVVVNPQNPVRALSTEQLYGIMTGTITSWAEVGGEDLPIAVTGRHAGSGSRYVLEQALGLEGLCSYNVLYEGAGALMTAVSMNPNAIGYVPHILCTEAIAPLSINGLTPTAENIADGSYPFIQTYCILLKPQAQRDEAEEAFVRFVRTANIHKLLDKSLTAAAGEV